MNFSKGILHQKMSLGVLCEEELQLVHISSLKILERTGIRIMDEQVLEKLKQSGARINIDKQMAYLPSTLIEECLEKCPSSFMLASRDGKRDLALGSLNRTYVRTTGGPEYILDVSTNKRRKITTQDLKDYARLIDGLENIDYCKGVFPNDVPILTRDVHLVRTYLENMSKHIVVQPYTGQNAKYIVKLALAVTRNPNILAERPIVSFYMSPVPPLQYSREQIGVIKQAAIHRIPLLISSIMLAGANTPATLLSCLTMINAETLAGIAISQTIKKGSPVIYVPRPYTFDMQTAICAHSYTLSPLLSIAITQLARVYGLPVEVLGPATDSKDMDAQSMLERTYLALLPTLARPNLIAGPGNLEASSTISPIQLVIDNDLMSMIFRTIEGIRVDKERFCMDDIQQVCPGGHFLAQESTLQFFRSEFFSFGLCDRSPRDTWEAQGRKTLQERAKEKMEGILKVHRPTPLDKETIEELRSIVEDAQRNIRSAAPVR